MKKVSFFRSIHIKFVLIYVLLILVAMQVIGVYFTDRLEARLESNFKESVREKISLLAFNVEEEMSKERGENDNSLEEDIRSLLYDFSSSDISEIQIINDRSKIIGTSDRENQGIVGKRATDLLIKRTLVVGLDDENVYLDENTNERIWVLATPIKKNDKVIGAIYLVATIENVYEQLREIINIFATGTIIALGVTAVLGVLLAQTITRPMSDMRRQALAMAKGNFSRKVKVYGDDEIGELAVTFNSLTKKLQDAQATTDGERRKLSSVLSFMTDGVIATDRKGRVILINEPAANLLDVSRETVLAMPIVELLGLKDKYSF